MSFWDRKYPLMQEGGEDGGGGGGGDGGDKGDKGGDNGNESSEMLMRGLAVVASGMSKLQESNDQLLSFMKEQASKSTGKSGDDGDKQTSNSNLFEGVDMEQLDRSQFAALLLSKFEERLGHHLKEANKSLVEKVDSVSNRLEEDLANREVQGASKDRPDFYEWKTEIGALLKDNPSLNVVRAYTIARAENADKAKKMDEKYAKPKESTGRVISLTPTGGGGRGEGATKMKFNEAAEKAYSDVLTSLGGVSLDQLPVVGKGH